MSQPLNDSPKNDAGTIELCVGERHRLLMDPRRRLTIDLLAGTTDRIDLEQLAAGIAARESGTDGGDESAVEHVATELHHVHLPMMAEMDVLEYDPQSRVVASSGVTIDSVAPTNYFDS